MTRPDVCLACGADVGWVRVEGEPATRIALEPVPRPGGDYVIIGHDADEPDRFLVRRLRPDEYRGDNALLWAGHHCPQT